MTARVDHVRRESLPWRPPIERLECRTKGASTLSSISRAEFSEIAGEWNELVRDYARAGMKVPSSIRRPNVCLTCWEVCGRWPTWERGPIRALYRELDSFGWYPAGAEARRMCQELWALGRLATELAPERFERLVATFDRGYVR